MNGLPNKTVKSSIVRENIIEKEEKCCGMFTSKKEKKKTTK
jgi:hypothetical protein